jgi:hypothetical protein
MATARLRCAETIEALHRLGARLRGHH